MTNRYAVSLIKGIVAFAVIVSIHSGAVGADQSTGDKPKTVRDIHLVHFEISKNMPPIGFSVIGIKDWPGFVKDVQAHMIDLPFSAEMQLLISSLIPHLVNIDEKKVLLSELNKMLLEKEFFSQLRDKVKLSSETKALRDTYLETLTEEDLQWLNRSLINDLITSSPRVAVKEGKKFEKLRKINCLTCHEAWSDSEATLSPTQLTEMQKLEKMIDNQLINPRAVPSAKKDKVVADETYLKQFEILKKFIIRPETHGNPALIEAVHPENPYTFKPMLKRLVCIDCHAPGRPVEKIEHADGKSHQIKYLYGPIEKTENEAHSR